VKGDDIYLELFLVMRGIIERCCYYCFNILSRLLCNKRYHTQIEQMHRARLRHCTRLIANSRRIKFAGFEFQCALSLRLSDLAIFYNFGQRSSVVTLRSLRPIPLITYSTLDGSFQCTHAYRCERFRIYAQGRHQCREVEHSREI